MRHVALFAAGLCLAAVAQRIARLASTAAMAAGYAGAR